MKAALFVLFALASAPALGASNWCVHSEYRKKFPDCAEFRNIVDYNNCVVRAIAEKCKRERADVFKILYDKMMGE